MAAWSTGLTNSSSIFTFAGRLAIQTSEVVRVSGCGAFLQQLGDEIPGQQVNVLREERDEHLEGEVLGERARDAALEQAGKKRSQLVGGLAGDGLAVVTELGPG